MRYLYRKTILLFLIITICMSPFAVSANDMLTDSEIESPAVYPTTPVELIIKGDIYEQLDDGNSVIDLSAYSLTKNEAEILLDEVISENSLIISDDMQPEFITEDEYVKQIYIECDSDASLMASTAMSDEVDKILACIDDSMTDVEKALAVNDYFVINYCYDETYSIYTKEELFTYKTGVCAAYAAAYEYIMSDRLGLQCITVTSDGMNHAWNMLKIDGFWYHVDTTWNDPISDFPGRAIHTYFLLSDAKISDSEHEHFGWTQKQLATSTKYDDYFWSDVETQIIMLDGYYYYITQGSSAVCKRNAITGDVSEIYTINEIWPCWDKPGYYWRGNYSQIACHDGALFINTSTKILSMNLSGDNVKTIVTHSSDEGYIWGLRINGNKLEYFVSRDRWNYGVEEYKSHILRDIPGDINGDGKYNVADGLIVIRIGLTLAHPNYYAATDKEKALADVNGDGRYNAADALLIIKRGLPAASPNAISKFPIED